ncbi:MAG: hypothetical protein KKB30_09180 [Proteobacteria bacterium]|nr:hypothetical protein [Pseudomonadota bacterium]MBU1714095.1 hypothetical protein [Pseudomonadota bacterium]
MLKQVKIFFFSLGVLLLLVSNLHASSILNFPNHSRWSEMELAESGEGLLFYGSQLSKVEANGVIDWTNYYFTLNLVDAQNQGINFRRVKKTSEGGVIAVADTNENPLDRYSRRNILIIKLAADGSVSWINRFAHQEILHQWTAQSYGARDIIATNDGGYLILGDTQWNMGTVWPFLIKVDASGVLQWAKRYKGQYIMPNAVVQLSDSGYVVKGPSDNWTTRNNMMFKVDESGNTIEWSKKHSHGFYDSYGTLKPINDGGFLSIHPDGLNTFVGKYDNSGRSVWQNKLESTTVPKIGSIEDDGFNIIYKDASCSIKSAKIIKISMDGEQLWSRKLNTLVSINLNYYTTAVAHNGGYKIFSKMDNFFTPAQITISETETENDCISFDEVLTPFEYSDVLGTSFNLVVSDAPIFSMEMNEPVIVQSSDLGNALILCQSNQAPIADAGLDQTLETGCGSNINLDGSASIDPDGDVLSYTWTGPFGSVTGVSPTVSLPLGTNAITLSVDDGNGAITTDQVIITVLDIQPPSTSAVISGTSGTNDWYLSPVTLNLIATDSCSGVASVNYNLNGISQSVLNTTVTIDLSEGLNDISYFAVDEAGNTGSTVQLTANIDLTSPVITITNVVESEIYTTCNMPTPIFDATDDLSGLAAATDSTSLGTGPGLVSYTYNVTASDIAGNTSNAEVTYEVVEGIEGLIFLVQRYLASGQISPEMEKSLLKNLKNVEKIKSFIKQVKSQSGKKIEPLAAEILINSAECLKPSCNDNDDGNNDHDDDDAKNNDDGEHDDDNTVINASGEHDDDDAKNNDDGEHDDDNAVINASGEHDDDDAKNNDDGEKKNKD